MPGVMWLQVTGKGGKQRLVPVPAGYARRPWPDIMSGLVPMAVYRRRSRCFAGRGGGQGRCLVARHACIRRWRRPACALGLLPDTATPHAFAPFLCNPSAQRRRGFAFLAGICLGYTCIAGIGRNHLLPAFRLPRQLARKLSQRPSAAGRRSGLVVPRCSRRRATGFPMSRNR